MAELSELQLERDLDAWWNRLVAHEPSSSAPEPLRADLATVQYLTNHHTAPNPSPTFVYGLKAELLAQAGVPAGVTTMPNGFHPAPSTDSAPVRLLSWREQRSRIWGLAELAAVAALMLVFFGAAFGDGPFGSLYTVWQQADELSGEVGMYRGNAARTGVSSNPGPGGQPILRWKRKFAPFGTDEPVVAADGRIFLPQRNPAKVIAVDAATHETLWTSPLLGGTIVESAPAVGNGLVYIATSRPEDVPLGQGYLVALDAETGAEQWRYDVGHSAWSSPALANNSVYIIAVDGTLRAVDAQTGREQWQFDLVPETDAVPADLPWVMARSSAAVDDGVVYAASYNGALFAVDAKTGQERWRFQTDGDVVYTPAIADGTAYLTAFQTNGSNPAEEGWVYAVDTTTGRPQWTVEAVNQSQSAPVVAEGLVFLGSTGKADVTDSSFTALDANTGDRIWTRSTIGLFTSNLIYAHGTVYGTRDNGEVYALNPQTGEVIWHAWVSSNPLEPTGWSLLVTPAVVSGMVIVPASDGYLYAIGGTRTPTADPDVLYNLSELARCDPALPFQPDVNVATGTPSATLIPGRDSGTGDIWPDILTSEIPQGRSANDEAVAGILETLRRLAACDGEWVEQLSFYSRDALRRFGNTIESVGYPGSDSTHITDEYRSPALSFESAIELPDGRIGVVFDGGDNGHQFVIFDEIDGVWLIDERYEIVVFQATPEVTPLASPVVVDASVTGMYRGNAVRTGVSSDPGPSGMPELRWKREFGFIDILEPPTVAGGRIYFTQPSRGEVIALDAATGETVWTSTVGGGFFKGSPAVANGMVYVITRAGSGGANSGVVRALDEATGEERWSFPTGNTLWSSPAVDDSAVYLITANQTLLAVDALSGQERWRFNLPQGEPANSVLVEELTFQPAPVAVAGGIVYAANSGSALLVAVDAQTGTERWRFQVQHNRLGTPAVVDNTVYFSSTLVDEFDYESKADSWLYAVDATTGDERWSRMINVFDPGSPAVANGLVFFGGTIGESSVLTGSAVFAVDAISGETVWWQELPTDLPTTALTYANGVLYGSTNDGRVNAVDAETGAILWRADNGQSFLQPPSVTGDLVVVSSMQGHLYAIGGGRSATQPTDQPWAEIDISGLPPCNPPRRSYVLQVSGTPTTGSVPGAESGQYTSLNLSSDLIPQGEPADGETIAGIQQAMADLAACARPDDRTTLYRFFSDDFFRRDWVRDQGLTTADRSVGWVLTTSADDREADPDDIRTLPDGRVGVVMMSDEQYGEFLIYAKVDGQWLIDDQYQIVPSKADPAATPEASPVAEQVTGTGMYRGNGARTGVLPGPGPVGKPELRWQEIFGRLGSAEP